MRNPERIDYIIERLRALWKAHPQQRLAQLVINAAGEDIDSYYLEDEALLTRIGQAFTAWKGEDPINSRDIPGPDEIPF